MSARAPDPVLQRIVAAAVEATGASDGWIVIPEGEGLRVVAGAGPNPGRLIGLFAPTASGASGYVVRSGQPVALSPGSPDPRLREGVAGLIDRQPASVLAVPCPGPDGADAALELIDKVGDAGFSFEDVELATLLGTIAGAALAAPYRGGAAIATPAELHADLERLAEADPLAYRDAARVIRALVAHG